MSDQKSQQGSDVNANDEENLGGFSATPHEMTERLMRMNLTSREYRLVFFFIREIQGYSLREKIIKTDKMIRDTALPKQHVNSALKSLMQKGVIQRHTFDKAERGQYIYQFNEAQFERINATKTVRESYYENGKVIHISQFRSPNRLLGSHQISDHKVIDSVTTKNAKHTPMAVLGETKESLKKDKEILRGKIEESFTLFGKGTKQNREQLPDIEAEKQRQLARVKSLGVWN